MQVEDLILVSVDDHVVEPPDSVARARSGPIVPYGKGKLPDEGIVTAITLAERMGKK